MRQPKGYQLTARDTLIGLAEEDRKPTLGVAPPGSGKSYIMELITEHYLANGSRGVGLVAHRNMLIDQLANDFEQAGIPYTVMGRGYKYDPVQPVKIFSLPMFYSRVVRNASIDWPELDCLLIDEAHCHSADMIRAVIFGSTNGATVQAGYIPRGTAVIGFTATPLFARSGIYGSMYEIVKYSDLRAEDPPMHQLILL